MAKRSRRKKKVGQGRSSARPPGDNSEVETQRLPVDDLRSELDRLGGSRLQAGGHHTDTLDTSIEDTFDDERQPRLPRRIDAFEDEPTFDNDHPGPGFIEATVKTEIDSEPSENVFSDTETLPTEARERPAPPPVAVPEPVPEVEPGRGADPWGEYEPTHGDEDSVFASADPKPDYAPPPITLVSGPPIGVSFEEPEIETAEGSAPEVPPPDDGELDDDLIDGLEDLADGSGDDGAFIEDTITVEPIKPSQISSDTKGETSGGEVDTQIASGRPTAPSPTRGARPPLTALASGRDKPTPSTPESVGIPFGNYWLHRRIKVGGMAEVYEATTQPADGVHRTVAIKRIHLPLNESQEFVNRFIDEARITVQLNHPAIVQVHELGSVGQQHFIAMEYIDGRDFDTILETAQEAGAMLPLPIAVFVAQRVLEGLDFAHRKQDAKGKNQGIVHRDVSPPNILCSFEGSVKLADFGIAKAASKLSVTLPGIVFGKPSYMSPEQLQSKKVDRRSDIFALGVVLYEALAGRRLFRGRNEAETINNVMRADIPPIRSVRADVPGDIADILHKSLERDPAKRPLWASEMADVLRNALTRAGHTKPHHDLLVYMAAVFEGKPAGEPILSATR